MKAVFITGASSGLGAALARQYAKDGATLGLVGRRADALTALSASLGGNQLGDNPLGGIPLGGIPLGGIPLGGNPLGGNHKCYVLDVRDRAALHAAAQDFLAHTGQRIDIVIASAGISAGTLTEHVEDFDVFKSIVDTNLLATVATFEPFIPVMRQQGQGSLVGIGSVAGVRGLPGAGAYSASKAALATYCESLRLELHGDGIRVVTIAPGYIRTPMTAHNPYGMPFLTDADVFAQRAQAAIGRGVSYTVIPWQMGIVARLMRVLPNWLYDRAARNAPRKPRRFG